MENRLRRLPPPLALFKPERPAQQEVMLDSVKFTVHKLNNRPRPTKRDRIKVVGCFSEFGCETIGTLYCLPRLLRRYPGQYVIAMGWWGRDYLYRHLVDEFWELDESYAWLRDYARAFHNLSKNLKRVEEAATAFGDVVPSATLGKFAVSNVCRTCGKFWHEWRVYSECCPACKSTVIVRSVFSDTKKALTTAQPIPRPGEAMQEWAKSLLGPKPVGIFARGRKTYGRNLPPEFYARLIELLEKRGYSPIWLGEKQSTIPCPVDHIMDFSRMPEARELERTFAIVCNLEFTVQFWTASTRLSGMMGVPYLLFESPEQIYSSFSGLMSAQEGKRLELSTFGPGKRVISHFRSALENQDGALELVDRAVSEMEQNRWDDVIGLVEDEEFVRQLQREFNETLV